MFVQLGLSRSNSLAMESSSSTKEGDDSLEGLDGPDMASMKVKFTDMNEFQVELRLEDALVLSQVEKRTRERTYAWAEEERVKGPNWFTGIRRVHSLSGAHIRENLSVHLGRRRPNNVTGTTGQVLQPSHAPSTSAALPSTLRPANPTLKQLIRKGIPPQLRPHVWMSVSGAQRMRDEAGIGYYLKVLQENEDIETEATAQIESDLHRTFPGHPKIDTPEGLAKLRRVLVAYSFRASHVGYCQGMNYVAAYLILVFKEEEDAFWVLCTLVENVLFDDCFAEDLFGCHVEQRVLKDLLKQKKPRLVEHLDQMGFELSLVATEWFLCIFAKSFPSETTLRVWDVLFHEGAKVLFRVALAIFQVNENELLAARHVGEAVECLVRSTAEQYDPDMLLQEAFEKIGSFPMSKIKEKRRKQTGAVAAALEHRQQQLAAAAEARISSLPPSSSMSSNSSSAPNTKHCSPPSRTSNVVPRVGSSTSLIDEKDQSTGGGSARRIATNLVPVRSCFIDRTMSM